ncbi:acyl-CoA dehydrogenase family protein [Mycolicibacterium elephantis]
MRDEDAVRRAARSWFERNWDPDLTTGQWWQRLAESGWGLPRWPREWYGRSYSASEARAVDEERVAAGALGPPAGLGVALAAPTILAHGTTQQKERYLWPIATGEHAWCQLFSEPGAGSDLAAVQTRAVRRGDDYVVSGQKVWTSNAHHADFGLLIARTDPEVPKHKGISFFLCPMSQGDAVTVRPLRELTGRALFNEVFLTEAVIPASALLGKPGDGWRVAQTTLAAERAGFGEGGDVLSGVPGGSRAGYLTRRAGDMAGKRRSSGTAMSLGGGGSRLVIDLIRQYGRTEDPAIRQKIAQLHSYETVLKANARRARALRKMNPEMGVEALTSKLQTSRISRLANEIISDVIGMDATLAGVDSPKSGAVVDYVLFNLASSIYGGTDQIQRNILAERVLGLPREAAPDHAVAFREITVGTAR